MARAVSEIDRLIEEGLSLYGEGDLDGALLLWERVLVIDPENAQANSYVDYVRMNYELLTSDNSTEDSGPFGIDSDEPEYQIEISPGEGVEPSAPLFMDDREHGWGITDDSTAGPLPKPGSLMLELEADEPPVGPPGTFTAPRSDEGDDVSFEDATREYPGGAGRPTNALLGYDQPAELPEFNEVTPGFGSPEDLQTPQSFASQPTDVRRRDFGFVRPATGSPDAGPPELKMTLRTPGATNPPGGSSASLTAPPDGDADRHRAPTADGSADRDGSADGDGDGDGDDSEATDIRGAPRGAPGAASRGLDLDLVTPPAGIDLASAYASLELDLPHLPEPQIEENFDDLAGRADTRRAGDPGDESDLVASLPTPRPQGPSTRPMPGKTRPPAFDPIAGLSGAGGPSAKVAAAATHVAHVSAAGTGPGTEPGDDRPTRDLTIEPTEPALASGAAPTQELPFGLALDPQFGPTTSQDFADKPTNQIAARQIARPSPPPGPPGPASPPGNDVINAPTRELGLRELALRPDRPNAPAHRANTEEETTGQVDVFKGRPLRGNGKPDVQVPLPGMDPIDARSADILEQIDRGAPAVETREERTRRRITALLDRASAWGRDSDVDRAVTAVDLALSEDPNSALAQKLIHRNREAIMNAFQAFLGDLQRTPSLARPLHELGSAPISPRAAFLLSRVDGTLSLDEILDVSGMPRLEAYRYLCQLFLRGILR